MVCGLSSETAWGTLGGILLGGELLGASFVLVDCEVVMSGEPWVHGLELRG